MEILFQTCILISMGALVTNLQIFEPCSNQAQCPEGSTCTYRGCSGQLCLCNEGLLPGVNRTRCVQGVSLGSTCTSTSICEGQPYSECRNNVCECLDGYRPIIPSDSLLPSHCLPVSQSNDASSEFVDFDEACDDQKRYCSFDFVCKNGTCRCRDGKRLATKREIAASPYSILLCRPEAYRLGEPIAPSSEECQRQVTSTAVTTTITMSTSTTPQTSTSTSTPSTTSTTTTQKPTTTQTTTPTTTQKTTTSSTTRKPTTPTTTKQTTAPSTQKTTTSTTTQRQTTPTTTQKITTYIKTTLQTTTKSTVTPFVTSTTVTSTSHTPSTTISSTQRTTQKTTSAKPTRVQKSTTEIITKMNRTSKETPKASTTMIQTPKLSSSKSETPFRLPTRSTHGHIQESTTQSFEGSTSNLTVNIGDLCSGNHCPNNSVCEEDNCGVRRCRCTLGYAESPDGLSCFKLAALGESCTGPKICQGPFTECTDGGICDCQNEYERSDTGKWCRLKSRWLISFPLLGESCSGGFFSSCYMDFEQDCVGSRCKCKEGNREVGDDDRFAMYPDIRQCRNSSYSAGVRDKNLCQNQSKQSISTDLYDKAKSKIRKIQAAIIGGSVGFLVLIGILIGLVVLIRWKRRGKRQVIRDTSSMASSERYSFKIPRPFTHYVGAKEYDSQQIGYPNPTFQHDSDVSGSDVRPDILNVSGDSSSLLTSN